MKKLLFLLLIPSLSWGAEISLSWDAPTQFDDGSPLSIAEIKQYRFTYTIDGVVQPDIFAPNTATSLSLSTNVKGSHCFAGYTQDVYGAESVASVETPCKAVTRGKPKPPKNLR
jgi:hypothetical protein